MADLEGKRVTVMGLGRHGGALGTIEWLISQGARVTVTDMEPESALADIQTKVSSHDITWVLGQHREEDFSNADLVIRNPAVPADSPYLQLARSYNVPVEMDSSLFFRYVPTKNIIGVVGSIGKSTCTHAIAHLLHIEYPSIVTVGMDGHSPLGKLPQVGPESLVVFELSNSRLQGLGEQRVSPQTAIVTSILETDTDEEQSLSNEAETKKNIFRFQTQKDRVLLNADDTIQRAWGAQCPGNVYWYSLEDTLPGNGILVKRGDVTIQLARGGAALFPLHTLALASAHEQRNVLPAILLAFMGGMPIDSIQLHTAHLTGLAHRLERAAVHNGITYINDSAATTPEATIAALDTYKKKHIVLIMGGGNRLLNFERLGKAASNSLVRAFVFIPGPASQRQREQIAGEYASPPPMYTVETMPDAVQTASSLAQRGDMVLFSPAARADLFSDEFDRGDQFKAALADIKETAVYARS